MAKYPSIAITTKNGFRLIDASDIMYCQAEGHRTRLYLIENKMMEVNKKLKEVGELLGEETFARIHHSTIINLAHLKEYINGPSNLVRMSDGSELAVSTRRKGELIKKFIRI
ncbi:MAG: LytTR family DNA-binding domain-containing protein [Bacteroidota bacterium]